MTTDQVTFEDLGLSDDILQALTDKGFKNPTPVQEQTIPLLLSGEKDIIGQAQTGTGKTAAFGLPILEKITPGKRTVQAIIVAPTRELANQVAVEMESMKAGRDIRILPVYGGQGMSVQLKLLKSGVDIVVATPGRAIDHLNRGTLKLDEVEYVVLDEADEMLNMGFIEDIEQILSHCQEDRRMLLFSATMPKRIQKLAERFMGDYDMVKIKAETESSENVEQVYYSVYERDKLRALHRLIETEPEFYTLVFSRTRAGADRMTEKLNSMGFDVEALHGEVSQAQRERILAKFKKGHANILIATDVAARGIDINNLTHVINFDLPDNPESYVHRIGRTGRAGRKGKAISFVAPKDRYKLKQIMRMTKAEITKMQLPFGQEVIDGKKQAMMERVVLTAGDELPDEYNQLAEELLESSEPKKMLAAMLQMHFGSKLDPESYPELRDPDDRAGGGGAPRYREDRGERRRGGGRRSGGGGRRDRDRGGYRDRDDERGGGRGRRSEKSRTERNKKRKERREGKIFKKRENDGGGQEQSTAPGKKRFSRPADGEKKKFTKKFDKSSGSEGVGKPGKGMKTFKKKKAKIKVFG